MALSSMYHTGPVTALCCQSNIILAGIGCQLQLYCAQQARLLQCVEALPSKVIHGICPENEGSMVTTLCIYGQKCMRLLDLDCTATSVKPSGTMIEFPDWIWDVAWLKSDDDERNVCLALGHNVIVQYNVSSHTVTHNIDCEEKCILYCATFLCCRKDSVILAAGTVFNQVVLWSPQSSVKPSGRVEPFHRLTGHQGVIFSVDFNRQLELICSVSDDRSIRLYKVHFRQSGNHDNHLSDLNLSDWENMKSALLHVLYGHSARVWDVKLLSNCFVSVGEDCTCCVWSYDGQVIRTFKGHKGKSIWSMAVDRGENFVVTGGGDNSIRKWKLKDQYGDNHVDKPSTKVLDFLLKPDDFPRNTCFLDSDTVLTLTNNGNLFMYSQKTDQCLCVMSDTAFSSYSLMEVSPERRFVALANINGLIRILRMNGSTMEVLSEMKICEGKVFSLVWLEELCLLTTGPDGHVQIWKLHDGSLVMMCSLVLPESRHRWVSCATFILDCTHVLCGDRTGSVFLYKLCEEEKMGDLVQTFLKIHGKAGVTFTGCHGDMVYTAGRDGLYRTFEWSDGQLNIVHVNKVYKGFEWIEKLMFTDDGDIRIHGFSSNYFVEWSVHQNQKLLQIECGGGHRAWDYSCHGNKATFVWIKAREVKVTSVQMRSDQVMVKQCLHGRELCDAKFVGMGTDTKGEAVYAVATCSEDTSVCLSFLHCNNGITFIDVCHTLRAHISTVRCLFVCPAMPVTGDSNDNVTSAGVSEAHRKLIFSAGGRAQLRVWRVLVQFAGVAGAKAVLSRNEEETFIGSHLATNCQHNLIPCNPSHETDKVGEVQQIVTECHTGNIYHNSCKLGSSKDKLELVYKHGCSYSYESLAGIQLTDINRKVKKPWRQQAGYSDPETRILDLSVVTPGDIGNLGSGSLYFIAAACSDGFFRLLCFDEISKEITLLNMSSYHDHCVLKVSHTIICSSHVTKSCDIPDLKNWPIRIVVLSAATDGRVAFWDISDICRQTIEAQRSDSSTAKWKVPDLSGTTMEPFFCLDLHQSGINSVYIGEYSEDSYILITGGDDNALKVNIISLKTSDLKVKVTVVATGCNLCAHAAQITGVWYVSPDQILTASIDQRVTLWQMHTSQSQIQLELLDCIFTNVSDVANIDLCMQRMSTEERVFVISGNGLEVIAVKTQASQSQGKRIFQHDQVTRV